MLKNPPKQARSRRMVDDILAGATRILSTVPLERTTTNHIAEVAGVSIGSLYQYFDSKELIAVCLLVRHCDEAADMLHEVRVASRGYDMQRRLMMPFGEFLCEHRRDMGLHRAMATAWQKFRLTDCASIKTLDLSSSRLVREVTLLLQEERPDAAPEQIALFADLYHQNAMLLSHSILAQANPLMDRTLVEHFDSVLTANMRILSMAA